MGVMQLIRAAAADTKRRKTQTKKEEGKIFLFRLKDKIAENHKVLPPLDFFKS